MTKLEELIEISRQAAGRWSKYEQQSMGAAHAMRAGIASFLGCHPETVAFRPILKKSDDDKRYAAIGAMDFSVGDGYWHFGLVVSVGLHGIIFHFMMKLPSENVIVVKPFLERGSAPTFEIQGDKADFSEIGQWIFNGIKDNYENSFERFVTREVGPVKIGFK